MPADAFLIGDVSLRVGLSIRTLRYYEEVGLVAPDGRTESGFRLYTESDIRRLLVVRAFEPAEASIEDLRELLALYDRLTARTGQVADGGGGEGRQSVILDLVAQRIRLQRERLITTELALDVLRRSLSRERHQTAR